MRHITEWTPFSRKVSNRQRPVRFRSEKCDFQNETINDLSEGQNKLHSITGKSTYFYKQRWFKSYLIPVGCAVGLLLVMGICINPIISESDSAFAANETSAQADGMSVSLTMDDPDESLLRKDSQAGAINYMSTGFKVKTENVDGYNVYVQTSPGSTNKLTNGTLTIDFVKTDTPASGFTDNTWGYAVDDTGASVTDLKYNPVPDAAASALNPAYSSSASNDERNFTLNFAAKFASDATPGHYTSGVLLSVAAGASEVVEFMGFKNITYMQQMTSDVCKSADVGEAARLMDSRDNKQYWIAKLKDGNCWMTQNLDLDLYVNGAGRRLSTSDSDVSADWVSTTGASILWHVSTDDNKFMAVYYDPGAYLYTTPSTSQTCSTKTGMVSECSSKGWISTTGMTASNTLMYGDVVIGNIYDAHYALGNYYSWGAATAGSNVSITGDMQNATQSICPRGWKLPPSSGSTSALSSFEAYGAASGIKYGGLDIRLRPFYYLLAGNIWAASTDGSSLGSLGSYAAYATSTSYRTEYYAAGARDLAIQTSYVETVSISMAEGAYAGFQIRCVAR